MKDKKRFISLKTKIMISTLVPVVISFALICAVVFFSFFDSLQETAKAEFLQINQKYAYSFEDKINNAMNYLSILASELEMQVQTGSVNRETLQKTVLKVFDDYKLIDGSSVYFEPNMYDRRDADYKDTELGTVTSGRICWYFYIDDGKTAYLPEGTVDDTGVYSDVEFTMPHYTKAKEENKPIYTDPTTYDIDGRNIPMFTLTYPVQDPGGNFIGAVTVDLFLDDIYTQLQSEKIYETGYVVIANDNERIIYSPNYEDTGKTWEEAGLNHTHPAREEGAVFINAKSLINGKDTLEAINPIYIPQLDRSFYISVAAPLDEINGNAIRLTTYFIIFSLLVAAVIALLLYYLIGKLSAPLREITESVDEIAGGEYGTRIKGAYKGEFAVVKDSVNKMAGSIETYIKDMEMAAVSLDRRLKQQAIMTAISQSFLSDADIDKFIANTLRMTGEFMGVTQILFYKFEDDGGTFTCQSEWLAPGASKETYVGEKQVLPDSLVSLIKTMPERKEFCLNSNAPALKAAMEPYMVNYQNYISVPIFVKGNLYGALDFYKEKSDEEWSASDISLATHVSSLMSGVFDRHSMEEQLRRLSSIVESSPQYIVCVTADGTMNYANPALMNITGLTEAQLKTIGLESLFDEQAVKEIKEIHIPKTIKEGTDNFELYLTGMHGHKRNFAFSSFTIGATDNIGCIVTDMTEFRTLESELITAKEQAEQGSRSKSEFLSRMSHEIRTPLNAIIGMNAIAMNTDDTLKTQDCHGKIDNASKHLLGIINDILDMSKIEADKFELFCEEYDFEKALMNITNVINFRAEEKHQNLVINLDREVPDFIFGDELRVSQVITNLLSNAVKFTPDFGTILLNAKKTDDADGEVTLQIEVVDNGIGISEEQQKRLFTSFEQADGSISRKFGGTGLGLAISKRIIELMGGEIWIESEVDKGSKFIFNMKVKKGRVKTHTKLSSEINKDNIHILAVDDSVETRLCFLHVMEAHGLPCDTAVNGPEALDKVMQCKDRPYNIFFIDWQMPEMDGIELTRKIKEITGDNSVVFMISVTDWSVIEKEAVSAGVRRFVPKPLFSSTLIDAVNECLGARTAKAETLEHGMENKANFNGHTILIAEDVEINQEIMSAVLEETGVVIDFADNGQTAVSMFKENPGRYSLILMDIHMPEMDGYEATRTIRALAKASDGAESIEKAKDIPIIAMTANVFKEDVENCLAAGMNGHLGKPVDPDDLFGKLSKYLQFKEYNRSHSAD